MSDEDFIRRDPKAQPDRSIQNQQASKRKVLRTVESKGKQDRTKRKVKKDPEPTLRIMSGEVSKALKVNLGSTAVYALLDTGASVSVINFDLFTEMHGQLPFPSVSKGLGYKITCANGTKVQSCGIVDIEIRLGNTVVNHSVHVLRGITQDLILGLDFLRENGVIVDLSKNFIKFNNENLALDEVAKIPTRVKLLCQSTVKIPANSEAIIYLRGITCWVQIVLAM